MGISISSRCTCEGDEKDFETFDNRYEYIKLICYTGKGLIYKGYDNLLERDVIVKYIECHIFPEEVADEDLKYNEVEMNKKVDHPGFLKMLDYQVTRELIVIVYEYYDHSSSLLHYYLNNRLAWYEIYQVLSQIASIIKYMHLYGFCIRNIAPSNFLIVKRIIQYKSNDRRDQIFKELHVKLMSLSKAHRLVRKETSEAEVQRDEDGEEVRQHWELEGRYDDLFYSAFESMQNKGRAQLGRFEQPADIYAYGVLAFYLSTGKFPFTNPFNFIEEPKNDRLSEWDLKFLDDKYPAKLRELIKSCLRAKPRKRPRIKEIADHGWFREMKKLVYHQMKEYVIQNELKNKALIEQLAKIKFQHPLVRMIWYYMSEKYFDKNKMLQVGLLFRSMDVDSDGRIDDFELAHYLCRFYEEKVSEQKKADIMSNIDINHNLAIEFSELKVVGMATDYNKIQVKLIQMFKMLEKQASKPENNSVPAEYLTYQDVVTVIQDGNTNYNLYRGLEDSEPIKRNKYLDYIQIMLKDIQVLSKDLEGDNTI